MKRAAFCVTLAAAAMGGCAYDPAYVGYDQGYGYGYPAGYNTFGGPGYYYGPSPAFGSATIHIDADRRHGDRRYGRRSGDIDRDGIPNRADRDRDGDGVPNRLDDRPNNPRRQ
ncbi:MAG TPA: thrombospondin type 3 repeat-containing protein [Ramlibacter sp.]|uniref:thrombospondin type 3 repeat-containing protein n=1 Tax=Ramlibacter sp. TaxID=1917967 RepID=UPI002D7F8619|nr:thrombospondin type 3 repeat-containing protein [Ramlibacter sp.]HET8748942.1 thrombospondin type 3 repeat-containing protein [Ramlibacter sp.]